MQVCSSGLNLEEALLWAGAIMLGCIQKLDTGYPIVVRTKRSTKQNVLEYMIARTSYSKTEDKKASRGGASWFYILQNSLRPFLHLFLSLINLLLPLLPTIRPRFATYRSMRSTIWPGSWWYCLLFYTSIWRIVSLSSASKGGSPLSAIVPWELHVLALYML